MSEPFGTALRDWRDRRGVSQLELAARAGVSQRHISFLETGRASPSRQMVVGLGRALDVPLRERNLLLDRAGFAPVYSARGLGSDELEHIRETLQLIASAYEPFPAYVVDRSWNVVLSNGPAAALVGRLVEPTSAALQDGMNVAKLTFHPEGIRPALVNWEQAAAALLHRLELELRERPNDRELAELHAEILDYPEVTDLPREPAVPTSSDLLVPLHLQGPQLELRLFTTIATIGAAFDVTLDELRLESLLPADAESDATLRALV
ncbi:MAG: helix-turn-helix domain-containing protein [Gaiellaceae bacterium]